MVLVQNCERFARFAGKLYVFKYQLSFDARNVVKQEKMSGASRITGKLNAALTWSMGFSGLVCWLILLMFPWSYTRSSRRNSAWRWQPSKLCQSRLVPEIMNTSKFITSWCPIGMFFGRKPHLFDEHRVLQEAPDLVPVSECFSWCGWQPNGGAASDERNVEPERQTVNHTGTVQTEKYETKLFEQLCLNLFCWKW